MKWNFQTRNWDLSLKPTVRTVLSPKAVTWKFEIILPVTVSDFEFSYHIGWLNVSFYGTTFEAKSFYSCANVSYKANIGRWKDLQFLRLHSIFELANVKYQNQELLTLNWQTVAELGPNCYWTLVGVKSDLQNIGMYLLIWSFWKTIWTLWKRNQTKRNMTRGPRWQGDILGTKRGIVLGSFLHLIHLSLLAEEETRCSYK